MTFYIRTGSLTKPTSGTPPITQDSPTLPEAPKAVFFYSNAMWESNPGTSYTAHFGITVGFSDGTNHRCVCMEVENAGASSATGSWLSDAAINLGEDANDEKATVSFSSTKFTLSWSKVTAQAGTIFYTVIGGTDITNVKVGDFAAPVATGNSTTTGTTFTPDIEFYLPTDKATLNAAMATAAGFSIGAAMSSSKQWTSSVSSETGRATMDTWRFQNSTKCISNLVGNTGVLRNAGTFVAFTSTGRTINFTTIDAVASKVYFMAIQGGNWDMGMFTVSSGTGTFTPVTGMAFQPTGLLLVGNGVTTDTAASEAENRFTFGSVQDTTTRNCIAVADADNTANAQSVGITPASKVYRLFSAAATAASSTTHIDLDISTLNSNGFTINKVTNSGTLGTVQVLWVGMATSVSAGPTKSVTLSESITLSSTTVKLENILRPISESITLSDSPVRLRGRLKTLSHSLTLSDSYARLRLRLKTLSESIALSDSYTRLRNKARTTSDSLALTSPLTKLTTRLRTLSHSLTLVDSYARLKYRPKTLSDSITLSDSNTRIKGRSKTITESLTLSDSYTKLTTRLRTLSHSLTLSHTTVMLRNKLRSLSHSLSLSDSLTKLTTRLRTLSHSLSLTDSYSRLRGKAKSTSDSVTTSSTITQLRNKARTISDSLIFSSTLTKLTTRLRTLSHTIIFADSFVIVRMLWRTISNSLTLSDFFVKLTTRLRALSHSFSITHTTDRYRYKPVTLSHSLILSHTFTRLISRLRTLSHSLTFTDSETIVRNKARTTSDSLAFSSTLAKLTTRLRTLSHSISFIDQLTKGSEKVVLLFHSLTLSDSFTKLITRLRSISNSLTFTDSETIVRNKTKTLSHSITLTDSIAKLMTRLRTLSFSIILTDQLTKGGAKIVSLAHSLTLTDSFTRLITRLRAISDTLSLVSTTIKLISKQRFLTDSVVFSSITQQLKGGFSRVLSHSITVTSTIIKQTTRIRVILETLQISDIFTRLKSITRGLPTQNFVLLISNIQNVKGKYRSIQESGLVLSHSTIDKMINRIRVIAEPLTMLTFHNRITDRIRTLSHSKTFNAVTSFIRGGIGIGILPTTVFIKHLKNKLIFKK